MYFIALQMLFGDRGKYLGMIVGITFAALIMTQQPAIFTGLMSRTYSFIGDVSLPDIWVMDPGVKFVEEHKPLRDTELGRVRGIEGVEWAAPMYKSLVIGKLPDGSTNTFDLTGLDDATLVGAPPQMVEGSLQDLRKADSIIVGDEAAKTRLRVKLEGGGDRALQVGDTIEINDRRAVVVALAKVTRNFVLQPQIYTTYSRAMLFAPPSRRQLTYVLVKGKIGQDLDELTARIRETTGLAAYTKDEFKKLTYNYWMKNTGIPINFGISVMLGFIVGTAIAGQTFFNFVHENLKQYAALKAMGLRSGVLVRMVLLQAFTVGIIGYGIGVGLTSLFGMKFHDSILAFLMPPEVLMFSGGGVFLIVTVSALLAIRQVIKVDPSVVFRG
ncbi:MAG: FtsX-like permease family protein [Alphaproteobacteria bacterium]|nr:FtsX-like permease family protein [Alphaproteobacteria bacterium]